jgi:hypothetical protein
LRNEGREGYVQGKFLELYTWEEATSTWPAMEVVQDVEGIVDLDNALILVGVDPAEELYRQTTSHLS